MESKGQDINNILWVFKKKLLAQFLEWIIVVWIYSCHICYCCYFVLILFECLHLVECFRMGIFCHHFGVIYTRLKMSESCRFILLTGFQMGFPRPLGRCEPCETGRVVGVVCHEQVRRQGSCRRGS